MTRQQELRMAWTLWNVLTDVTQRLWDCYEDDFVTFCLEEEDPDYERQRHDECATD
jgi:hypothetical protein